MRRRALIGGSIAVACAAALALGVDSTRAVAQVGAPGGVTVYDAVGCSGSGNASHVTPPFSVLITGLPPFSRHSTLYVTDKDASPEITYGPYTIPNVNAQGAVCLNVQNAPSGTWKIDVVEEGSGSTDSKVVTVEGGSPITTVPVPTTTPRAPTTTTMPTTSTTGTSGSTSTTLVPPPTTATPTTVTLPPEPLPFPDGGWTIEAVSLQTAAAIPTTVTPTTSSGALPRTGSVAVTLVATGAGLTGMGLLVLVIAGDERRWHKAR
jgi:hypothetical protein